ncbi:MAG TPA: HEAT repeat domain-containing protein [bacterium]|nr:HEAT repeat domain-containing protein [bacterium]
MKASSKIKIGLVVAILLSVVFVKVYMIIQEKNEISTLIWKLQDPLNDNFVLLRDIAEFGPAAVEAGPIILKSYDEDEKRKNDPFAGSFCKICAVRTLGYIGYKEATEKLLGLLDDDQNWVMVYVTVESLGRLRAQEAIPALTNISRKHWFRTVRDAAVKALKYIDTGDSTIYPRSNNFPHEYFSFEDLEEVTARSSPIPEETKKLCRKAIEEKMTDPTAIDRAKMDEILQKVTSVVDGNPNQRYYIDKTSKGIKVDGGYMIGTDHGEFGGHVLFVTERGEIELIARDHPIAIVTSPIFGIVVASGYRHLGQHFGVLFKVFKNDKNEWQTQRWFALPGAAVSMDVLKDGLYINAYGGDVVIRSDGSIMECD